MTGSTQFRRARRPEQKEERRAHLLEVARMVLAEHPDTRALSLNELARRAAMTKSNVYRYFESREDVLLELLLEEWVRLGADVRQSLAENADGHDGTVDITTLTKVFARSIAARPLLAHLSSILPSIIEHNISVERVRGFKQTVLVFARDQAEFLCRYVPVLSPEACEAFLYHAVALMNGLWPLSHPSPVCSEVLQAPAFEPLRYDFEHDFSRGLLLYLRGLLLEAAD